MQPTLFTFKHGPVAKEPGLTTKMFPGPGKTCIYVDFYGHDKALILFLLDMLKVKERGQIVDSRSQILISVTLQ